MKIGINSQLLSFDKSFRNAGISKYSYNLINALMRVDKENEYFIFLNKRYKKETNAWIIEENFKPLFSDVDTFTLLPRIAWEEFVMPCKLILNNFDLFHSIADFPVFCPAKKKIITIFDLIVFEYKEFYGFFNWIYRFRVWNGAKKADKIIAISEATKRDIISHFKIPKEKIDVIYLAANNNFGLIKDKIKIEKVKKKYNLPPNFILQLSTLEPRKNLIRVLEAYNSLKQKKKLKHKLVVTGAKGWLYSKIFDTLKRLGLEKDVVFTGYIPDSDLPPLYNAASCFVFPSLYEGFGLPVVEAMQSGCPVITSNTSSLPEVGGDAAYYVNPYNVNEIADAIETVLNDGRLRRKMVQRGLKQAKKFGWEKCAKGTLEVYEEVMK